MKNFYVKYENNHLDANDIYPQVVKYKLSINDDFIDKETINVNNNVNLPKELTFHFYLDEKTVLTDVISFTASFGKNMIVSSRLHSLIKSSYTIDSEFYKAKVYLKEKEYNYYFWLPKMLKFEGVDFNKSEFMNCFFNRKKIASVNVSDEESYIAICKEMKRGLILAEKLYFNAPKYYTNIIIRLWFLEGIYFSPELSKKILDSEYTGVKFIESNVIEVL